MNTQMAVKAMDLVGPPIDKVEVEKRRERTGEPWGSPELIGQAEVGLLTNDTTTAKQEGIQKSMMSLGFPGGSVVKNLPANAGDSGSIRVSGKSPEGGNGNPLQYSYLEDTTDRGTWWATVHGVTK